MPDRTQTLFLVEVDRALAEKIAEPKTLTQEQAHDWGAAFDHVRRQCRTALSQPEQRGAEQEAARKRWPDGFAPISPLSHLEIGEAVEAAIADCLNEVHMQPKDSAAVWAEAALQLQARLDDQPPTPALSDDDRERLNRVARFCDEHWDPVAKEDAAFLRTLASQEQGGGECDGCERRRPCVSIGEEVLCGECIVFRANEHEKERAQEVGGLRERLLDAMASARQGVATAGDGGHGFDSGDLFGADPAVREKAMARGTVVQVVALDDINAALDEVFPPPSDSHGDQGQPRCATCGDEEQVAKNFGIDSPGRPEIVRCPDCNPASTQVEGERDSDEMLEEER